MKKTFRILMLLAATTTAACSNQIDDPTADTTPTLKTVPVEITAAAPGQEDDTRTSIDITGNTFVTRWSDGDQMSVSYGNTSGQGTVPFTFDKTSGKFRSELPAFTGAWTYDAFLPYYQSAPTYTTATGTLFQTAFGNHRTQNGSSFNYMYDPLLATRIATTNAEAGKNDAGEELEFGFQRLTSILKCRITGGSATQRIKAVLLTATDGTPVSSSFVRSDSTIETAENADGISPVSNVVVVTFDDGTAPTTADADVYFNVIPIEYTGLQIDVICEDGKIAGRKYTTPITFNPGEVTVLNLDNLTFRDAPVPTLVWPNQDMNAVHDITLDENKALTYDAAITIGAPAGIAGLTVNITSNVLNGTDENQDGIKDGITKLDLFNETSILGAISYKGLGLSCSTQVQYTKSTIFNITGLIPLINDLGPAPNDLHIFEVQVTDLAGHVTTQALTFRTPQPQPSITYDKNANAWTNTATLTVANVPATATGINVQYRRIGTTDWKNADGTGNGTWTISPVWTETAAGSGKWTVDNTTGIFAGDKGYEYQLTYTDDQGTPKTITGNDIPAIAGSTIPTVSDGALSCYTTDNANATFWGSGNNSMASNLCKYTNPPYAYLKSTQTIGILAPGNLFTGIFTFVKQGFLGATSYGTVGFGQKYDYKSARPTAIKLTYKATFGNDWSTKWEDANHTSITSGHDQASIIVCITNWSARHNVTSGNNAAPTGSWNPETLNGLSETEKEGLIAYGVYYPDEDKTTDTLLEIPLIWYDKAAAAPDGNYTIVIGCSTSRYGDYLNGTVNEIYVKDFKWVY